MRDEYMTSEEALKKFKKEYSKFCFTLEIGYGEIIPLNNLDNLNNSEYLYDLGYPDKKPFIFINNVFIKGFSPPKHNYFLIEDLAGNQQSVFEFCYKATLKKEIYNLLKNKYFLLGQIIPFPGFWNSSEKHEDTPKTVIKFWDYGPAYMGKVKPNTMTINSGGDLMLFEKKCEEGELSLT